MSKEKKYYLLSNTWKFGEVIVKMTINPKTIVITPISPKPQYKLGEDLASTDGCIDQLWDDGKIVIKDYAPPKVCRHALINNCDGTYTIYPNRDGIPFELIPVEVRDDYQN